MSVQIKVWFEYLRRRIGNLLGEIPSVSNGLTHCPGLYTRVLHRLGAPEEFFFVNFSVDQLRHPSPPNQPVVAILGSSPVFEENSEENRLPDADAYEDFDNEDRIFAMKAMVYRACTLYAIIHAACNGLRLAQKAPRPESTIACLLDVWNDLGPANAHTCLEKPDVLDMYESELARHGPADRPCIECSIEDQSQRICYQQSDFWAHHIFAYVVAPESRKLYLVDSDNGFQALDCSVPQGEDMRSPSVADAIEASVQNMVSGRVSRPCLMMALMHNHDGTAAP